MKQCGGQDSRLAAAERARDWVLKLASDDVTREELQAFHAWLDADESHRRAYQRSREAWQAVAELDHLRDRVSPELLEPAVAHRSRWRDLLRRLSGVDRPAAMAWRAAVATLVLAVLLVPDYLERRASPGGLISSGTGELREVQLADGSQVTLGAESAVLVKLTPGFRRVTLARGEAYFDVARDEKRPFLVRADDLEVRVLGTRFEVHKGVGETRVSVEQGLVTVQSVAGEAPDGGDAAGDTPLLLSAGEGAVKPRGNPLARLTDSAPAVTGWRQGRLAYDGAPLREVIADANRYYHHRIHLADAELGDLRVTASFRTDEIGQMIAVLEGAVGVRAEVTADRQLMLFSDTK